MAAKKKKKELNYLENLSKEFKQFMRAKASANSAEGSYQYRNWQDDSKTLEELKRKTRRDRYLKEEKDRALKKERNAKGQLAGALLQGRRYKGNKQVKNTKKK